VSLFQSNAADTACTCTVCFMRSGCTRLCRSKACQLTASSWHLPACAHPPPPHPPGVCSSPDADTKDFILQQVTADGMAGSVKKPCSSAAGMCAVCLLGEGVRDQSGLVVDAWPAPPARGSLFVAVAAQGFRGTDCCCRLDCGTQQPPRRPNGSLCSDSPHAFAELFSVGPVFGSIHAARPLTHFFTRVFILPSIPPLLPLPVAHRPCCASRTPSPPWTSTPACWA
jgi:hypothetical protein